MEMDFSLERSNLRPRRSRHRYWDLGWPEKLTLVIIAIGACLASSSFIIYSAMLPILPHGPEIRADVPSFGRLCLWTIQEVCNGRTVDMLRTRKVTALCAHSHIFGSPAPPTSFGFRILSPDSYHEEGNHHVGCIGLPRSAIIPTWSHQAGHWPRVCHPVNFTTRMPGSLR
jgi:hypothetical protein